MGLEFHIILRSVFIHRENRHLGTAAAAPVQGEGLRHQGTRSSHRSVTTDIKVLNVRNDFGFSSKHLLTQQKDHIIGF